MRGVRYGEVLAVYVKGTVLEAEVYGTQMLNDCPAELWDTLRADEIAADMGAVFVKLNGPRKWLLDGLGVKVASVEPVLRDFNGLTMRRIATVELGNNPSSQPYMERTVDRGAVFFFDAGKPVFELANPDGKVYVMQALCMGVDPNRANCSWSFAKIPWIEIIRTRRIRVDYPRKDDPTRCCEINLDDPELASPAGALQSISRLPPGHQLRAMFRLASKIAFIANTIVNNDRRRPGFAR